MDTVLIQLTHQKALRLLQELEDLNIIKLLKSNVTEKKKLSEKYAGKLPLEIANELEAYVNQSREEWNNRHI